MNKHQILELLTAFKNQNYHKYSIQKLGLFGSAARGTESSESDIDIVIELEEPDMFALANIKSELEFQFKKTVDIIRKRDSMNPFLKNRIERDVIYV